MCAYNYVPVFTLFLRIGRNEKKNVSISAQSTNWSNETSSTMASQYVKAKLMNRNDRFTKTIQRMQNAKNKYHWKIANFPSRTEASAQQQQRCNQKSREIKVKEKRNRKVVVKSSQRRQANQRNDLNIENHVMRIGVQTQSYIERGNKRRRCGGRRNSKK